MRDQRSFPGEGDILTEVYMAEGRQVTFQEKGASHAKSLGHAACYTRTGSSSLGQGRQESGCKVGLAKGSGATAGLQVTRAFTGESPAANNLFIGHSACIVHCPNSLV